MKGFCDLPKPVREKIYRMHLLQDDPVKFPEFKVICNCIDNDEKTNKKPPRIMPPLLQVSRKIEHEASPIYFGENVFQIEGWKGLHHWICRLWPRHTRQIRRIRLAEWTSKCLRSDMYWSSDFKKLKSLRMLQFLIVVVDENKMLQRELRRLRYYDKWHDSLDLGPQAHLQMMHVKGMAALRSLRGLRNVEFSHPKLAGQQGSIPGGFLETTAKREMMQPVDMQTHHPVVDGSFRFLDLPPEVRNIVYDMLMANLGVIFPDKGHPTSIEHVHHSKRSTVTVPHSVLDLLGVNRQIHDEADGIFYRQNDLVFQSPARLQTFISNLGMRRLDALRSLTFFYNASQTKNASYRLDFMEATISTLRLLRGLRKLHVLIKQPRYRWTPIPGELDHAECHPARLDGIDALFKFRNLEDLQVLGPHTVDRQYHTGARAVEGVKRLDAIFRHFNHGLRFAQKGQIFSELYKNKNWADEENWPALGTEASTCGLTKGCSCGQGNDGKESGGSLWLTVSASS